MQILTIRPKIGQKIETAELPTDLGKPTKCPNCGKPCFERPSGLCLWCEPVPAEVDSRWHQAATELSGKLAENSAEADRMTYAGRSPQAVRSAKTYDETRLESMPLFEPARRQGRLL